jgi:hypothetical protein
MGRHRLRAQRYLVCNYLGDGNGGYPSNIRECRGEDPANPNGECGTQLWVSAIMTPLTDAGQLLPICWICHVKMGGPFLRIHPIEMEELVRLRAVKRGQQIVNEMNEIAREDVTSDMIRSEIGTDERGGTE